MGALEGRHIIDVLELKDAISCVFIRPHGSAYHFKRNCGFLAGNQFERLKYFEVIESEAIKKGYTPCPECGGIKRGRE